MHYFAYGSNLSVSRLRKRVPSALALGVAVLRGHRLAFHKVGRDGSAKCNARMTGRQADDVHGVLYCMDARHKSRLDAAEGLGRGYQEKAVRVRLHDGRILTAFTYFATHIDTGLRPYAWYLEHVIRGAREHGLPRPYTMAIAAIDTIDDPDQARHRQELAVYA